MFKKPTEQKLKKEKLETVWHLYASFGIKGGGQTTIAFFENEDKGLDFLEKYFDIGSKLNFYDKGSSPEHSYYEMEFTADEAINSGFLDMYKMEYWSKDTIYILFLEETPLNEQLIAVVPEDGDEE